MDDDRGSVPIEALLSHREWVRGLARGLVHGEAAAEDLEQEVWLGALRHPPAHDRGLRGWFRRLARSRAVDAHRAASSRGRREEAVARPEAGEPTAEVVARAEAHRAVVEAVMALEEPYRATVLLRDLEDAGLRADAVRALHGAREPSLRDPLLRVLREDPDRRVREEAAETLDDFLDDLEVLQGLRTAAISDTDPDVREQARRSLGVPRKR